MKKFIYAVVFGSAMVFLASNGYSQEPPAQRPPRAAGERPGMPPPGVPMGGVISRPGMGIMQPEGLPRRGRRIRPAMMRNPHLAGIMMEMRGEMMRIRGEAMMKEGDVLRRYGERLQKESAARDAGQPSGR